MKLGLGLGYWSAGPPPGMLETVKLAEDLGYDSVWTAEAYGSDALTPLAWIGSHTTRMRLGTSIVQLSARTPTATAMAAMTLDHLSDGRFALGVGASGPQVVEGWYGQPYPKPLARTREYVEILRRTIARETVTFDGDHYRLPHPGKSHGGIGLGKPLRSTLHPRRTDVPIMLAAEGPNNVAMAAEIADGWFPLFYSPYDDSFYRSSLEKGFARPGARRSMTDFEVVCMVNVVVDDDLERAADELRPFYALYVGGMGARGANFHFDAVARLGFEAECKKIQDLYLEGRKDEAAAAVPVEMVEKMALIGPRDKIATELAAWQDSLVTTMVVTGNQETLRMMAELTL